MCSEKYMFLKKYVLKKPMVLQNVVLKDKFLKKKPICKQFGIDFQSCLKSNFFDTLKTTNSW